MPKKTYLAQQIKLVSLSTYDLFTDEEYDVYLHIIELLKEIQRCKQDKQRDPTEIETLRATKRQLQQQLDQLIAAHKGTPRTVRLKSVLNPYVLRDENGIVNYPNGVNWLTLKTSKKITQFMSQQSRALGLSPNDVCWDKIIVRWKSQDLLEQIVLDGIYMPIIQDDGSIQNKYYIFSTASAGQLRTDKIQLISQSAWNKIQGRIMCGLSYESINDHGGINTNKMLAYMALPSGATSEWTEFDIDKAIVIPDFEAPVTAQVKYVNSDYTYEVKQHTFSINHGDGFGVMLPSMANVNGQHCGNFMVRLPFIKGLLTEFDYIKFCNINNCPAIIKDRWGLQHDLIKQEICVMFTQSQLKLAKYFDSWDDYKQKYKSNHCSACRTNYQDEWIDDTDFNYQMIQTLQMSDQQIQIFTKKTYNKIQNLTFDKYRMLQTLGARKTSESPYSRSLALYPELLRDGYAKQTLKAVRKRWMLDAKSCAIKCANKRLFAIPDVYAACEYWFQHIEQPKGLLYGDEVFARPFLHRGVFVKRQDLIDGNINPGLNNDEQIAVADVLRSPHLTMQHFVCPLVDRMDVRQWFVTNGIYTSCHSTITKRLALDVD